MVGRNTWSSGRPEAVGHVQWLLPRGHVAGKRLRPSVVFTHVAFRPHMRMLEKLAVK
jgi:hypothetical protein